MRILWLCNTLIGEIAEEMQLPISKPESWIKGLYEQFKDTDSFQIEYLFPCVEEVYFEIDNFVFKSFEINDTDSFINEQVIFFCEILKQLQPDVVHIWGTEFIHSYSMIQACKKMRCLDNVIISIQGLVGVYARHYYAYMPIKEIILPTLRDFLKKDTYYDQKKNFIRRGKYEEQTLRDAVNVIGRTEWDEACVKNINPSIRYFFCNENLRTSFYEGEKWNPQRCERHSIFVSQSNYPIKGFHLLLEVLPEIVRKYPDVHVYTTGNSPLRKSVYSKLKITSYDRILTKLIKQNHLEEHITFLGYLNEEQMLKRFLKSHVFISTSSIENSPNSVGEAMLLGIPVIASDVGGVKNLLNHSLEGYLYQADAPYMIPYYIDRIFDDEENARKISELSIKRASVIHDKNRNFTRLIEIYEDIIG